MKNLLVITFIIGLITSITPVNATESTSDDFITEHMRIDFNYAIAIRMHRVFGDPGSPRSCISTAASVISALTLLDNWKTISASYIADGGDPRGIHMRLDDESIADLNGNIELLESEYYDQCYAIDVSQIEVSMRIHMNNVFHEYLLQADIYDAEDIVKCDTAMSIMVNAEHIDDYDNQPKLINTFGDLESFCDGL